MDQLLLFALTVLAVTALASVGAWWWAEPRRTRRALRRLMGGRADAVLAGRRAGAALDLREGMVGLAWDAGDRTFTCGVERLVGAEVIVDGQVADRAFRAQGARGGERLPEAPGEIRLRLVVDDAREPEVQIVIWRKENGAGEAPGAASSVIGESRRWLARLDALLRSAAAAPRIN